MPQGRATQLLKACCGSSRWVSAMVARRPFGSLDAVLSSADEIWESLQPDDWLEAFAHHPRIGEQKSAIAQDARGSAWSGSEQSGLERAPDSVRGELSEANAEYEKRFGYIYIVCATGKTAEEMVALARERLRNSPRVELAIAAEEQRRVTQLRIQKLLGKEEAA